MNPMMTPLAKTGYGIEFAKVPAATITRACLAPQEGTFYNRLRSFS